MGKVPLHEWRTEHLRLSAFTVGSRSLETEPSWWQGITNSEPDEVTTKRGLTVVSGAAFDANLELRIAPDRVDWILKPAGDLVDPNEMPSIGPVGKAIPAFSGVVDRWSSFETFPEVIRVAFGAVFFHAESGRRDGYLRLPDYLPVKVDPESTDFLYQINRPTTIDIDGVSFAINRLSKWSIAMLRFVSFEFPQAVARSGAEATALRVEVDINTTPNITTTIPRSVVPGLFQRLAKEGLDIAENGVRDE